MSKSKRHFDPTFLAGLVIAGACILGGLVLEKGKVQDVAQITAVMIVFGGTCGAVIVSTPKDVLIKALKRSPSVLWSSGTKPSALLESLIRFANLVRKDGPTSIEKELDEVTDPLLKKGLHLVADGVSAEEIRTLLEMDILLSEQQAEEDARVFEAAGGYAPTIGIIGAVLGLMQVMKHLDSIQDVGRGIAIAFVATVYGVGMANLICLPMGSKIRTQARMASKLGEMVLEGVIAIQKGKNPRLIRQMLLPFLSNDRKEQIAAGNDVPTVAYAKARKAS